MITKIYIQKDDFTCKQIDLNREFAGSVAIRVTQIIKHLPYHPLPPAAKK